MLYLSRTLKKKRMSIMGDAISSSSLRVEIFYFNLIGLNSHSG